MQELDEISFPAFKDAFERNRIVSAHRKHHGDVTVTDILDRKAIRIERLGRGAGSKPNERLEKGFIDNWGITFEEAASLIGAVKVMSDAEFIFAKLASSSDEKDRPTVTIKDDYDVVKTYYVTQEGGPPAALAFKQEHSAQLIR